MPPLSTFLQMRNDPATFAILCSKFIVKIIGHMMFSTNATTRLISDFVKPCDEAMAILMIENSYDRWRYQAENISEGKGSLEGKVPLTRYTTHPKTNQHVEWEAFGLRRFIELHKLVIADCNNDRESGCLCEGGFLRSMRRTTGIDLPSQEEEFDDDDFPNGWD